MGLNKTVPQMTEYTTPANTDVMYITNGSTDGKVTFLTLFTTVYNLVVAQTSKTIAPLATETSNLGASATYKAIKLVCNINRGERRILSDIYIINNGTTPQWSWGAGIKSSEDEYCGLTIGISIVDSQIQLSIAADNTDANNTVFKFTKKLFT